MNEFLRDELTDRLQRLGALQPAPAATRDALARVRRELLAQSGDPSQMGHTSPALKEPAGRARVAWAVGIAAALMVSGLVWYGNFRLGTTRAAPASVPNEPQPVLAEQGPTPQARPAPRPVKPIEAGTTLTTQAGERRRVTLADGSVLYLNQQTEVRQLGERHLRLVRGEVYVEVNAAARNAVAYASGSEFTISTPTREVSALGTRFGVRAEENDAAVVVTQGKVKVSDVEAQASPPAESVVVEAGQQMTPGSHLAVAAPRVSHLLGWTRDLMSTGAALVPSSQHAGGALVAVDRFGQPVELALRKYIIDVHIEDGFARTSIDQTYFNTQFAQMEGTFHFPLPPDATLSRLAMYVDNGQWAELKEGGMVEREHARNVYESFRYTVRRDPALLEWVDGSTFKMRVFPIAARQEKRILLSYTQRLSVLYGAEQYRFPGGHNMNFVKDWQFKAVVKNGAKYCVISPSHPDMDIKPAQNDILAQMSAKNIKPNRDVRLDIFEVPGQVGLAPNPDHAEQARLSSHIHEGHQYVMLRYRPSLISVQPKQQRRDWVFLFETSANRDPLLARTQIEIVRTLLENAGHDDTFSILTAGTRVRLFEKEACTVSAANIDRAVKFLEKAHLIGALDLSQALRSTLPILSKAKDPWLVHVGAGIAAMGERREDVLAKLLPANVPYVGVGVGKRWSRAFMKTAAERTSGYFTQINPDEPIAWRAFELLATLNTPRLLELRVSASEAKVHFLNDALSLAQGEEVCAIARLDTVEPLKGTITVSGKADGIDFKKEIPVENVAPGAGYLPRQWAKLEIDRLLAEDAAKNKQAIIDLSKASYVMSPYTSLLVLETDADYARFKVDRGRKDHWALYESPAKIPVVYEYHDRPAAVVLSKEQRDRQEVLKTVLIRTPPQLAGGGCVLPVTPIAVGNMPDLHGTTKAMRESQFLRETVDWVSYYKNHGYGINAGAPSGSTATQRIQSAPVFVDPNSELRWILDVPTILRTDPRSRFGDWTNPDRPPMPLDARVAPGGMMGVGMMGMMNPMMSGSMTGGGMMMGMPAMGMGMPGSMTPGMMMGSGGRSNSMMGGMGMMGMPMYPSMGMMGMNGGSQRIQFAPVFVSPGMQWAVPSANLNGPPPGAYTNNGSGMTGMMPAPFGSPAGPLTYYPYQGMGMMGGYPGYYPYMAPQFATPLAVDALATRGAGQSGRLLHNNCCDPCGPDLCSADPATSLVYKRPSLAIDSRLFSDLSLYAPALNTSDADIQAVLEAEAKPERPVSSGAIAPAARKLIDKARSLGWSSITLDALNAKLLVNGAGQFAFENTLPSGLKQQVYCDGKTLLHLYPEIGLGARRTVSRFHRAELAELSPWLVLPAEDLALGADLKCVDERTVAIIPLGANPAAAIHMVFATDGRLSERRLVALPSGKVLARQTMSADGTVHLEKTVVRKYSIAPANAPNLHPDVAKLVVVPMPLRTRDHVEAQIKKNFRVGSFDGMDEDHALRLLTAECLQNGGDKALQIFGERFHARGDRRLGFYTLLLGARTWPMMPGSGPGPAPNYGPYPYPTYAYPYPFLASVQIKMDTPYRWGKTETKFSIEKEHPADPLAKYLSRLNRSAKPAKTSEVLKTSEVFIAQLAEFHALCTNQTAEKDRQRALAFVKSTSSSLQAWLVLERLLLPSMGQQASKTEIHKIAGETWKRFGPAGNPPGLAYIVRYESAVTSSHYRELHADALQMGMLPPIDARFIKSLSNVGGDNGLAAHVRRTQSELLKQNAPRTGVLFAWQLWQLNEKSLADEVLTSVLRSAPDDSSLMLSAIDYLCRTSQWQPADDLLQKILALHLAQVGPPASDDLIMEPALWRLAAEVAGKRNMTGRRVAGYLEKVVELESQDADGSVDVKQFRDDRLALLKEYRKWSEPPTDVSAKIVRKLLFDPADLKSKIVRAADRWRTHDPELTTACHEAAGCLEALGDHELAWDYLTTPIGMNPNEADPWLKLAVKLVGDGKLELGDRAYAAAYDAEPTNAQILWDRAANLQKLGQTERAMELYRQIASGAWQPRFQELQRQAAQITPRQEK